MQELTAVPVEAPQSSRDLSANVACAAAKAKRDEVYRQAPVMNTIARFVRLKTEERAWRLGAKGEAKVGKELDRLPDGWHTIHAVPIGKEGSDINAIHQAAKYSATWQPY